MTRLDLHRLHMLIARVQWRADRLIMRARGEWDGSMDVAVDPASVERIRENLASARQDRRGYDPGIPSDGQRLRREDEDGSV